MPRHTGLWRSQWEKCHRCSFTWPLLEMVNQKGLLLCPRCQDNLDVEYRPMMIAEVLADTVETENEREHIADDPQTILF